ncbi:MAG: hypothetical protein ACJAU6_003423 [Alphaproteobacteria bacterium]|jgi:hypothetical protein
MGKKNMGVFYVFAPQPVTQVPDPSSRIKNDASATARNFDATCVAAECDVIGRWRRNTAAHPPKLHLETHSPRPSL